jgi:hypothetical protein
LTRHHVSFFFFNYNKTFFKGMLMLDFPLRERRVLTSFKSVIWHLCRKFFL